MTNGPYIVDETCLVFAKNIEEENERLRAENETLRRDVKTAIMGDSAELQDVKRENETLREALKAVFNGVIQENEGLDWAIINRAALRAAAAAIRETDAH